jgi:hypothetical protein
VIPETAGAPPSANPAAPAGAPAAGAPAGAPAAGAPGVGVSCKSGGGTGTGSMSR